MDFKTRWVNEGLQKMKLVYPDSSDEEIVKFLSKVYDRDKKDSNCLIYNNYEKTEVDTTVEKVLDWLDERKPILTESGSLFKRHGECENPDAMILKEKLDVRDAEKKLMFKYEQAKESSTDPEDIRKYSLLAEDCDLNQSRYKVIANSEYGVSGLSSSWFFNMACASATTSKGKALISTAYAAFEDFLADNVKFWNMDECISFINNIVNEKNIRKKSDDKWINDKDVSDVLERLQNKFLNPDDCNDDIINSSPKYSKI